MSKDYEHLNIKAKHIIDYMKDNNMIINSLNLSQMLNENLIIVIGDIAHKEADEEAFVRSNLTNSIYKEFQHKLAYLNIIPSTCILSRETIVHSAQVFIDSCSDTDDANLVKITLSLLKNIESLTTVQLNLIKDNTHVMFDLINENMTNM